MLRSGMIVTHARMPGWGYGLVLSLKGSYCDVLFENYGIARLGTAFAERLLTVAGGPVAEQARQRLQRTTVRRIRETPAVINRKATCEHCRELLQTGIYNDDRSWKSCPCCSQRDGEYHVFYRYPAEFGTSVARANDSTPDGAQSHCIACRQRQAPSSVSLRCGALRKASRKAA